MVALFRPHTWLAWVRRSRDLWRTPDGRFDLIDTHRGYWCVIDGDTGTVYRSPSRALRETWAAGRERAVAA